MEKEYVINTKKGDLIFVLNKNTEWLYETIYESKKVLEFEDDYDGMESEEYSLSILQTAVNFLINYTNYIKINLNLDIIKPHICNGPNGGIDLLLEDDNITCLFYINKDDLIVNYYCENKSNTKTKGSFDLNKYDILLLPFATK